jgi:hypothetical protein
VLASFICSCSDPFVCRFGAQLLPQPQSLGVIPRMPRMTCRPQRWLLWEDELMFHALVVWRDRDVQTTLGLRRSSIRGPDHRGSHSVDLLCEAVIFQSLIMRRSRYGVDSLQHTIMPETRCIRVRRDGCHRLVDTAGHQHRFQSSKVRTTTLNVLTRLDRYRHSIIIGHYHNDA